MQDDRFAPQQPHHIILEECKPCESTNSASLPAASTALGLASKYFMVKWLIYRKAPYAGKTPEIPYCYLPH